MKLEAVNEPVHLPLQASNRQLDSFKTFSIVHPPDDVSFCRNEDTQVTGVLCS